MVGGFPVSALAALKFAYGLEKLLFAEVRPVDVGKIELGIRRLKSQKIAQALFAGSADYEVRVGHSRGVEAG